MNSKQRSFSTGDWKVIFLNVKSNFPEHVAITPKAVSSVVRALFAEPLPEALFKSRRSCAFPVLHITHTQEKFKVLARLLTLQSPPSIVISKYPLLVEV